MPRKAAAKKKSAKKAAKQSSHAKRAKAHVSKAAKHAEDFINKADALFSDKHQNAKAKKEDIEVQIDKAISWIKKHPVKATAGAAAAGWFFARLFGGRRK